MNLALVDKYKNKKTEDLKNIRVSLSSFIGDPQHKSAVDRIEAINVILNKRNVKDPEFMPENIDKHKEFDYFCAIKFAAKVQSSKERKIPFELSLDDFSRLMQIQRCYYTGRRIKDRAIKCKDSRTLDRIDSTKGYTRENTVACTHVANQLKNMLFENPEDSFRLTKTQLIGLINKVKE